MRKLNNSSIASTPIRGATRVFRALGIVLCAFGASTLQLSHATSAGVDAHYEYRKRIEASGQPAALGDGMFGEQVNLYDGSTSFVVTDIEIPGNNGLPVSMSRRLPIENEPETRFPYDTRQRGLGNWDIDVPYMTATLGADTGWPSQSCTYGGGVPNIVMGPNGKFHRWEVWHGVTINVPGRGQTRMLDLEDGVPRPSSGEFGATTSERDMFSCIPMKSGFVGSGVRMMTATGLRYHFDVGVVRKAASLLTTILIPPLPEELGGGLGSNFGYSYDPEDETSVATFPPAEYQEYVASIGFNTLTERELIYLRNQYYVLASKIEDRFGNWVQYEYNNNGHPTRIWSNDGREIRLTYVDGRLTTAVSGNRSWSFAYEDVGGDRHALTRVVLPDASRWAYSYSGTLQPSTLGGDSLPALPECQGEPHGFDNTYEVLATHPSGARGRFSFSNERHYRSGVHATECVQTSFDTRYGQMPKYRLDVPYFFDVMSLTSKVLSGPGIPQDSSWQYEYVQVGIHTMLWGSRTQTPQYPCTTCTPSKWVTVTNPDGTKTRERFGILYQVNDGRRLESQTLDATNAVLKSQTFQYMTDAEAALQPFHGAYGRLLGGLGDPNSVKIRPVKRETTLYSGLTFSREHLSFDGFARPASSVSSNGVNSKSDSFAYHDDTTLWVLSQPKGTVSLDTGQMVSKVDYNAQALPERVYEFGLLKYSLAYWPDGQLKTVKDGREHAITYSDYHRGVPRLIQYPGTPEASRLATVNDDGWITSVTDETDAVTGYGYDAMGRLASVVQPTGDAVAAPSAGGNYYNTTRNFRPLVATDWKPAGIAEGQWRLYEQTGARVQITYMDAMWRPILAHEYDTQNIGPTLRASKTRYDTSGRVSFQSYPSSDVIPGDSGTRTFYDAIDRVTRVEQDSEHGVLATSTEYLAGLKTRVTNPKGFSTTTSFMAWDQPGYDFPILSEQPEGKVIQIDRHPQFGWPLQLTQRNAGNTLSATRRYVYDGNGRLCKTIEPETGVAVMGYDGAGNLAWQAAGLDGTSTAYNSTTDCQHVAAYGAGRTATRAYDARNRLTHLTFPNGGQGNLIWTYEKDGLPKSVTAYNDAGNTTPVVTSYTYNNRRLLTGETLAQPGWYSWSVGYAYDGYGHLSTQTYPTGLVVDYAPNPLGQPTKAGTYASGAQYYPNGALKQFTYGNGVVHVMLQNERQLPSRVVNSMHAINFGQNNTNAVLDNANQYDRNGNVTNIWDYARGDGYQYSRWLEYDQLDRLTAAGSASFGGDHWHRMSYDALDNLKSWKLAGVKDYAEYVYDAQNHRLTSIRNTAGATVVGLDYDPQGNLQNKNGQGYVFDFGNRLRSATLQETYRYDGLGRRVLTNSANGKTTLWQYTQGGQMLFSSDWGDPASPAQQTHENVYLAGSVVAIIDHAWPSNTVLATKYQHTDALGSPVAVTNASGQVIERMDYEPWGAIIGKPNHNGIGYTGHVMDGATGLTYMQQRYYDQSIGRFLSVDPVAANSKVGANFNRYWYANNNPYRFMDPDGRQSRELEYEYRRSGAKPPLRKSEKDWLHKPLGYALGGVLLAPAAGFGYSWALANPVTANSIGIGVADVAVSDALGGAGLATIGALGVAGFKYGVTAYEISGINRAYASGHAYRDVSTVLKNASNYNGFYNKVASIIRDIAGGHLFENGNKRTAVEVAELLIQRNAVDASPNALIWNAVDGAAEGRLKTVNEISNALQGK